MLKTVLWLLTQGLAMPLQSDLGQWEIVRRAKRVALLWERLQSARLALQCDPDHPELADTVSALEIDFGLAMDRLANLMSDDPWDEDSMLPAPPLLPRSPPL